MALAGIEGLRVSRPVYSPLEGPATRALWKGADKRPGGTSAAPPLRPRDDHSRWNFPLLFAVMWCLVARTLLLLLGLLPAAAGYTCFPPRCCSRSCAARARPLLLQQRGVPEGGDATLDVQDLKVACRTRALSEHCPAHARPPPTRPPAAQEKPFYSWPMTPGYNAKLALLCALSLDCALPWCR